MNPTVIGRVLGVAAALLVAALVSYTPAAAFEYKETITYTPRLSSGSAETFEELLRRKDIHFVLEEVSSDNSPYVLANLAGRLFRGGDRLDVRGYVVGGASRYNAFMKFDKWFFVTREGSVETSFVLTDLVLERFNLQLVLSEDNRVKTVKDVSVRIEWDRFCDGGLDRDDITDFVFRHDVFVVDGYVMRDMGVYARSTYFWDPRPKATKDVSLLAFEFCITRVYDPDNPDDAVTGSLRESSTDYIP